MSVLAFPAERLMVLRTLLVLLAVLLVLSPQATVDGRKTLRENVGRVPSLTGYQWSNWYTALVPTTHGRNSRNYEPRERSRSLRYDDGIYELSVSKQGRKRYVVYIGSAHRKGPGSISQRILEYSRDGSHKAELINRALSLGYTLSVRAQDIPGSRRYVRQSENKYLAKYDYAWNKRNNGRIRGNVPPP